MITASPSIRALIPRVSDSAHLHCGACSAPAWRKKKEKKERKKKPLAACSSSQRQEESRTAAQQNAGLGGGRRKRRWWRRRWKRGPRDVRRGKREGGDKFGRQRERGKADKERWRTARAVAHCAADRQRDRPDRGNECSY